MPKPLWISFLLSISIPAECMCQDIQFKAFTNDIFDGSISCLRIMEDSYGFMWFGTYQGVYRYDGAHMEVFQHNPIDSNSINHNLISHMLQDGTDMYITAFGNGAQFNKISTLDNSVSRISIKHDLNLGHRRLIKLNNGYFLSGGDRGLIYFNIDTPTSTYIPNVLANPITQTEDGEILVSDEDTLLHYRIENNALLLTSKTQVPGHITSTAQIFGSRIYGTSAGMFSFDDQLVFPPQIRNLEINCLLVDSEGHLWVGTTNDGLFRWNVSDNTLQPFTSDEREGYLHSNTIRSLYEDSNQLLWVGTNAGPFFTDLSHNGISIIPLPKTLNHNNALPLYQPDRDILWVGNAAVINSFDLVKQEYKSDLLPIGNSNTIFGNSARDSIWISTNNPGIFQLARQKGSAEFRIVNHYNHSTKQNNKLSSKLILSVFVDDMYNVWFGHYLAGIDILKKDGSWIHLHDSLTQGVAISSFLQARDKSIWIGKLDTGLSRCQRQKDGSYIFKHYTPENSGLNSTVVTCLAEDQNNQIWIGTMSGGLYKLDPVTETFTSFSGLQGLKSNNILNVICDAENNIWCSTSEGVAYLASGSQKFRVFTVADGLPQNSFSFYSSCLLMDGRIAFGSSSGIALIDPDSLYKKVNPFKPFVSRILLHNKPLVPGLDSLIQVNPHLVKEITLTYYQDLLTFEFSNGYFKNPGRVLFAYRLEGYQRDWVELGKSNIAAFTRLPAGEYSLKVRSSIDEGKTFSYSEQPLQITVLPPWWQTWWFRMLAIVATGTLIYWVMQQRTQRLLAIQRIEIEKKLALEAERSRISRDMHDDLGSGLSAIHLLSNYVKENALEKYPEFSHEVDQIQQSSENLNQSIREIIWTVNSKDDSLQSLILFIQRFSHEMHEKSKIPIYVHAPEPVPEIQLNGVQRKHVYLCVKEAVNNALKHSTPNEINITIGVDTDNLISILVMDDGKGFLAFPGGKINTGNGLSNMKERMGDIGGQVDIKSSDAGTKVLFSFHS